MSIHKFPAEKITPLDKALTDSIKALSEVMNCAEIQLLRDNEDSPWFKDLRSRTQELLNSTLKLRADIWVEQRRLQEDAKQPKQIQQYAVGQIVKVNGWGTSDVAQIVDVRVVYHNRLGEYTWGYKVDYKGNGAGLTFEYVPECYLEAM